jgi:hypothetical protein
LGRWSYGRLGELGELGLGTVSRPSSYLFDFRYRPRRPCVDSELFLDYPSLCHCRSSYHYRYHRNSRGYPNLYKHLYFSSLLCGLVVFLCCC